MVPEAPLEATEMVSSHGKGMVRPERAGCALVPAKGRAAANLEHEGYFSQLGISLRLLRPGEPMTMYHWETDQEDFLVLPDDALLVVEGEERPLRQWDFVH